MMKLSMTSVVMVSLITTASVVLSACSGLGFDDKRVLYVDGEPKVVKVINIPSIKVEIDPRLAVCELPMTDGTTVKGECMQYRQPFQRNFNTLASGIEGFEFEPGYRYLLDVRQEAVPDKASGMVKSVWKLNKIISKTSEKL